MCRGCGRTHAGRECPVDQHGAANPPAQLPGVVDVMQLYGWGGATITCTTSSSTVPIVWTVPPLRPPDDPPPAGALARLR